MRDEFVFYPAQRLGLVFHIGAILALSVVGALGLWGASQASMGPLFLLYLLPVVLVVGSVPLVVYRVYALRAAFYVLERDGIHLRWGVRAEDIPMDAVLWVHPMSELNAHLTLPWLRWPGAVLGMGHLSGAGAVEFLADRSRELILIATAERVYAISPMDTEAFLSAFQRFTEMGSLAPLPARSVYPTILLMRVWADKPARVLLLSGLVFSLILWGAVSLTISLRSEIRLGFILGSDPGILAPAIRLLLLPVISTFFSLADMLWGLFLFRRPENQSLAYLLWGAGSLTPVLFLVAILFILRAGAG